jgi:hypothetical protein
VATFAVIFLYLRGAFHREPGHPQELVALSLCLIPLAAGWLPSRPVLASVALGGIAAFAGLCKINIGLFIVLGVGLALGVIGVCLRRNRLASGAGLVLLAATATALIPILMTYRHLTQSWTGALVFIVEWGLLTVFTASWWELKNRDMAGAVPSIAGPLRLLLAFAAAGMACTAALSAVFFARGTTASKMYDALIGVAGRVPDAITLPALTRRGEFAAALVLSAALAAVYVHARYRGRTASHEALLAIGKLIVGLFALVTGSLGRHLAGLMVVPLVWLAVAPLRGEQSLDHDSVEARLVRRIIIALAAVFQPLQMYPVAGSQRMIGGALAIYLGVTVLFDAIEWFARGAVESPHRARRWAVAACLALIVPAAVTAIQLRGAVATYRAQEPLNLPGASLLRLPNAQVAAIQWLVELARTQASAFVSSPGFNSLYFWTQTSPPTLDLVTVSDEVLTAEQQQSLGDAVAAAPRPLVITQRITRPVEARPVGSTQPSALETRLRRDYEIAGVLLCPESTADLELLVRPGSAPLQWLNCVTWPADGKAREMRWPFDFTTAADANNLSRVAIVDSMTKRVLADTQPTEGVAQIEVLTPSGQPAGRMGARGLLRFTPLEPIGRKQAVSVRLYGADGKYKRSAPVIQTPGAG